MKFLVILPCIIILLNVGINKSFKKNKNNLSEKNFVFFQNTTSKYKNTTEANIAINIFSPNNNHNNVYYYDNYYSLFEEKFFWARNIQCNQNSCGYPNFCIDTNTCRCGSGYANFKLLRENHDFSYCTYKLKKQLIAFILEVIFPFGLGHLYAGRLITALIKSILSFYVALLLWCLGEKIQDLLPLCCNLCFCCVYIIWCFVDAINFATNTYLDGNSLPLQAW